MDSTVRSRTEVEPKWSYSPAYPNQRMAEENDGGGGGGSGIAAAEHWWWAAAGAAQLTWGILSYRKGYAGDSRLMPFKAFAVASLFVGASASSTIGILRAHGIQSVEDMKEVGANVRTGLGIPPRARDE